MVEQTKSNACGDMSGVVERSAQEPAEITQAVA